MGNSVYLTGSEAVNFETVVARSDEEAIKSLKEQYRVDESPMKNYTDFKIVHKEKKEQDPREFGDGRFKQSQNIYVIRAEIGGDE